MMLRDGQINEHRGQHCEYQSLDKSCKYLEHKEWERHKHRHKERHDGKDYLTGEYVAE